MKKYHIFLLILVLALGVATFSLLRKTHITDAANINPPQLYGYAWSPNIGWISFNNCSDPTISATCSGASYSVRKRTNDDKLEGSAWSPNIGWINFDPAFNGPDTYGTAAKIDTNGNMSGWARATSFQSDGECPANTACANDWADGWISFDNISFDASSTAVGSAWGGNAIGWINMSDTLYGVKITSDPQTTSLTLNATPSTVEINKTVNLSWAGTNITTPPDCIISGEYPNGDNFYKKVDATIPMQSGGVWTPKLDKEGKYLFAIECTDNDGNIVKRKTEVLVMVKCTFPEVGCQNPNDTNFNKCVQNPCSSPQVYSSTPDFCGCTDPGTGPGSSKKVPKVKEN